ncbi:NUDIX hydrolase [Haloplanus halophilus]|uniref:NUDIX hydrolase n=1 Tax=Haloplanus halophilus TaxID=2949993 RepID=UPI002040CB40|nr:NUDIX domain-containing protein [Haloplanus sp. GDY1]
MSSRDVTYVEKVCAYITRDESEVLVFEGPGHDGLQVPKGTVEPGERPREAMVREAIEESGLATFGGLHHLTTDVWTRRRSPPKRYVRNFYHVPVHEPRDSWTHTVTGAGPERGTAFEFFWVDLPTDAAFALDLDDYLHALTGAADDRTDPGVVAD